VVEDSALIRRRIIDNVQSMGGFDVVGFAESEDEAIEAIKLHPDVVVTDIRLKEGNGIAVVRNIRADEMTPQPKIFVLTNFAYPNTRCNARWQAPTRFSTSHPSTTAF
jgi:CheY-like chemotaxis protein